MMKKDKKLPAAKITKKKAVIKKKAASELQKSKVHIIVEIIEYMSNAVVSKTILKKTTGNVTVSSFAIGEALEEKTSPFDIYIQIIDGAAEVIIDKKVFLLKKGNG